VTPQQIASRKKRDEAITKAERDYTWALESYNDGIKEARQVYDRAVAAAQEQWRKELHPESEV
jgi:hypothetical protein